MRAHISESEIREMMVWRVLEWIDEPTAENLQAIRDSADTLVLFRSMAQGAMSKEQAELLLLIQGLRAEMLGSIATLEIAAHTPQLPEGQALKMAQTIEAAIDVFIQLAEGM